MATTNDEVNIFIDTNILIRATVISAPQYTEASAALHRLWNTEARLWISRQVLREYAAVLTRPQTYAMPVDAATIAAQLRIFMIQFHIADDTSIVTHYLLDLLDTLPVGGKQVHDANIVATMRAYGIQQLLTLNTADFTRFSAYITLLSLENT